MSKWICNDCNSINAELAKTCHGCGVDANSAFLKRQVSDKWQSLKDWLNRNKTPIHVVPTRDIKEHEESINCWCQPVICKDEHRVILHNAFSEEYGDERNLE